MLDSPMVGVDESVPYSLVIAFLPQVIADSIVLGLDSNDPENEDILIHAAEMQGIKLLSSFDPGDSFQVSSLHAMYPWRNPKGYFLALYFPYQSLLESTATMPSENDTNTFDKLMLMIGIVVHRAYANIINLRMDRAYRIMEEFKNPVLRVFNRNHDHIVGILEARSTFLLNTKAPSDELKPLRTELKKILSQLRSRFQQVIQEWLVYLE